MNSRRTFLLAAGALLTTPTWARSGNSCAVSTKETQSAMTPAEALARLKAGNARFVAGKSTHCDLRSQVKATAQSQAPFAAVLGCMDSRVPPELVFDQHIGDLFVVRVAGNFVNIDMLGSLEYATKVVGAKLIVVLGHTDCGAVKGTIEHVELGNLTALLGNIRPAMLEVTDVEGERDAHNKKFLQAVIERNVRDAAAMLVTHSEVIAGLVGEGKLQIASAVHDVSTGAVSWLA